MEGSASRSPGAAPLASVVIPAHDEERVIGRTLATLLDGDGGELLEVVVVANGCHDGTAAAARRPGVTVLDVAEPGKPGALRAGDAVAVTMPRIYLDADVELDTASALALARALRAGDALAAVPERSLDLSASTWPVRAYYAVWQELRAVQEGIFGRGVVAVSAAGHRLLGEHTSVINDDVRADALLRRGCMVVDEAVVRIRCPRTTRALLNRRARTARGNSELRALGSGSTDTSDTVAELARIALSRPRLAPGAVIFAGLTVIGRFQGWQQHRAGSKAWNRDDSRN